MGVPAGSVVLCVGLGSSADDLAAELLVRLLRAEKLDAQALYGIKVLQGVLALRQAKAALRAAATMDEDAGLRFEQNTFGGLFASADKSEGMKAFLEKREPKWSHK